MKFRKFNSIENAYQTEFIASIRNHGFDTETFVVQEKVHGANLSFITDGTEVISAKRTGLIEDNEDFFKSKIVHEKYAPKLIALFQHLKAEENIKTLTVFGELFGGGYPHSDVPVNESAKLVQRGIYYTPDNDFFAFDILLDHEDYLEVETANILFEKFGFLYAKTLFKGTLEECLAYPNAFKTTLPAAYQLPELDGNICEGVVIRPITTHFFPGGSRVIIKNKNEAWSENNNHIDRTILNALLRDEEILSEAAENLCEEAYKFISENRLANLISKIGEVDPKKHYGKVLGLFNQDILADFLKTHRSEYEALEKQEQKAINKFVNKHAGECVNRYFSA